MASGLRSSIRLKVFKPADMNRAWITTVPAMSPAAETKRKNTTLTRSRAGLREPYRPDQLRLEYPAAMIRHPYKKADQTYTQEAANHTDEVSGNALKLGF
jgi:hypothetical protein